VLDGPQFKARPLKSGSGLSGVRGAVGERSDGAARYSREICGNGERGVYEKYGEKYGGLNIKHKTELS
jgi:hypothetical protein